MKRLLIALVLLSLLVTLPSFAAENDADPNILSLYFGTTNAATEASSTMMFVAPNNITLTRVYVVDHGTVTASTTDYMESSIKVDGTDILTFTSSGTSLVAQTPTKVLFADGGESYQVASGAVISASLDKVGSGHASTLQSLQLIYVNGW